MASSAGKRRGEKGKGPDVCTSSSKEVVDQPAASDVPASVPGPSAGPSTSSADQPATSSRLVCPDPYESWPDPNSSPYINWDPVQIDQSGFPFKDRKWICLCCFKGFQQRFSKQDMMKEHILRDHAVLQEYWKRGCFWDLKNCATCGKFVLFIVLFVISQFSRDSRNKVGFS